AARLTGGAVLKPGELPALDATRAVQYQELRPALLLALLALLLADVLIRRWEHVQAFIPRLQK
ncbi:MAG TPA: hypothetical protein PLP58_22605, partial [Prosthecobacter sp.]|nr:hypothetical protein [Prosthecobacter sp.]